MSEGAKQRDKEKRVLTREQQMIWRRDNRASIRGKSKDERKAIKERMMSQLQAMSESDRAKIIKDLQSKWDALPEAEKQVLKKKAKGGGQGGKAGKRKGKKGGAGGNEDDDE